MKNLGISRLCAISLTLFAACGSQNTSSNNPERRAAQDSQSPNGQSTPGTQTGQSTGAPTGAPTTPSAPGTPTTPTTPTTPVVPTTPAAVDCHKGTPFVCKIEKLIADKTNAYRASRNLRPLTFDAKIAFVSRDWSVTQSQGNSGGLFSWMTAGISHKGFPSARSAVYQNEFKERRDFRAENVAMAGAASVGGQTDADAERVATEFTDMWWKSLGHRANMLGNHKSIGVGMAQTPKGSWYGTQIFE